MNTPGCHHSTGTTPSTGGIPSSKWEVYDQLIAMIPEDLVAQDALVGIHWTLVGSI